MKITSKMLTLLMLLGAAFVTNLSAEDTAKFDIKLINNSDKTMKVQITYNNPNFLDSGEIELQKVDAAGRRLPLECEATDSCKTKSMILIVDPKDHYEKQGVELNNALYQLYVGDKKQLGTSMEQKTVREINGVQYNITYDKSQKKGNFEITVVGKTDL